MSAEVVEATAQDVYNLPLAEYWLVVDVRRRHAWARGHVVTAWNLPAGEDVSEAAAAARVVELWATVMDVNPPESSRKVVVYGDDGCAGWATSVSAAFAAPAMASKLRLRQVMHLRAGFESFGAAFPFLVSTAAGPGDALPCVVEEAVAVPFLPSCIATGLYLGSAQHAQAKQTFLPPPHGLGVAVVINAAAECPNYFDNGDKSKEGGSQGAVKVARAEGTHWKEDGSEDGEAKEGGSEGGKSKEGGSQDGKSKEGGSQDGESKEGGSEGGECKIEACSVQYVRMEWVDTSSQELRGMEDAVDVIAKARAAGKAVLVHCHRGRSRSASIVAAYLMRLGQSLGDALAHMRQCRPVAQPNDGFMRQLRAYSPR